MENYQVLSAAFLHGLLSFAVAGSLLALVIGIAMLVKPDAVLRVNQRVTEWMAARRVTVPLNKTIKIERYVYRRHRYVGALVLCGALYTLYTLFVRFNKEDALLTYAHRYNPVVVEWILESVVALLTVGSVVAALIGLVMMVRPSLLKGVEAWANRSYATPAPTQLIHAVRNRSNRLTVSAPRLLGLLICLGSLYVIINLSFLLLQ